MKVFSSRATRIFLVCWVVYAAHFATNVVREHYPAFSIIEDGDLKLDEYADFHADIFLHTDGHYYIGNQITGSLPAIPALAVFDPVLDHLEERRKNIRDAGGVQESNYTSEYVNRRRFMAMVKSRGLDLRFAGATVVTSFFCMAPICALFCAFMFMVLCRRGVEEKRATALTFLFAFATPVFYRAAYLNHNVFLMITVFFTFWLVWSDKEDQELSAFRRTAAGFCAGLSVALDYAGAVPLLTFYAYMVFTRAKATGFFQSWRESLLYVAGSVPPVAFLCWTQQIMYGNPFLPGQKHMRPVAYTDQGYVGFGLPDWGVFKLNLLSPDYGLATFGPLLVLAFWPALYRAPSLLVPRRERWGFHAFTAGFMIFCACNQYSRIQFNTGFRYLLPLVPFLFLLVAEHLKRVPSFFLWLVGLPCMIHTWVLCMVRYTKPLEHEGASTVPECWRRFMESGPQLPAINVFRQITPDPEHWAHWQAWPFIAFLLTAIVVWGIWSLGGKAHSEPE